MSAGSISLESSIRTCKVNPEEANRIESDRFLNVNNMVCPMWQGVDLTGRTVCRDSFYTKRAGCNSAEDRVVVENNVSRPQYYEYITLNSQGLQQGGMGGGTGGNNLQHQDALSRSAMVADLTQNVPRFGTSSAGPIKNNCGAERYRHGLNHGR